MRTLFRRKTVLVIFFIFGALWLPFGQTDFLIKEWMYLGLGAAALVALFAISRWNFRKFPSSTLGALLLICYFLHQFEEHGTDLLGRHYSFMVAANNFMGPVLGCPVPSDCPLNPEAIYWVNTILVWWPLTLAAFIGHPILLVAGSSLTLTNALSHIISGLILRQYNPGLLTAILLFLPVSNVTLLYLVQHAQMKWKSIALGIFWGVGGHALLSVLAVMVYSKNFFPHLIYPGSLFVYSSIPVLLTILTCRKVSQQRTVSS